MAMEMELIAYMRLGNTVYKMYTLQPNRNGLYRPAIPWFTRDSILPPQTDDSGVEPGNEGE